MLEITQVGKTFGRAPVLRGVDLSIAEGEFFSLLGPSGCGKTTLLRIVAGFERADTGDVRLSGVSLASRPAHERPFNMVFQKYALFPHLDVRRNVAFGLEVRGASRTVIDGEVAAALDLVAMAGMEDRRVTTLSGGQQQRVALARALVLKPRVLLLDEPLSAMDLKLRQRMQMELRALQRRLGMTFVFVTHAQDEALAMSDRIAVMHRGKVEQVGRPDELYHAPATPFVASFVGSTNRLAVRIDRDVHDAASASAGHLQVTARRLGPAGAKSGELLVRPERCELVEHEGRLHGTVRGVFFKGATREVEVELGGAETKAGATWVVAIAAGVRGPAAGHRVHLGFRDDDALIAADGGETAGA